MTYEVRGAMVEPSCILYQYSRLIQKKLVRMIQELLASTIELKENKLAKDSKIYTLGKWQ
jgi:hypothetical protein